jgi:hypothetical protein
MPALPLGEAGKFVAAAYVLFLTVLGLYVAIMARKVSRAERRAAELDQILRHRDS